MGPVEIHVDGLVLSLDSPFNGRQTAVQTFVNCHRYYGWERIENLTPDRPQWALEFGQGTHTFLMLQKKGVPLREAIDKGIAKMLEKFPKALTDQEEQERFEYREMAERMWPAYVAYYADDADQMIPLGLEVKGRVEVGTGTNVFLVFQIDNLVQQLGAFWIVDHKTMSRNDDRNFDKHAFGLQMTAYIYGATKVLGQRISGSIINGLIKTKVPQFRREHYMRTDAELLEFELEFPEVVREIAWRHKRVANGEPWKVVFYKNTDHCLHYNRLCPFFQLCQKDSPMNRTAFKPRDKDYMDDPSVLLGKGDK